MPVGRYGKMPCTGKPDSRRLIKRHDYRIRKRYFDERGAETSYVRYFSYMPQYTQLTAQQLAYYLYWRSQLLAGSALACDEGYIYLFAYECINLTDVLLTPKDALERLLTLWQNYAQQFPKINKYLSEWVSDLCLTHRMTLSHDKLGGKHFYVRGRPARVP